MNIALLGNQNCGKTTLFNRLTGNNAHAGNYPGHHRGGDGRNHYRNGYAFGRSSGYLLSFLRYAGGTRSKKLSAEGKAGADHQYT